MEEIVFENLGKNPGKLHYQTLITLVVTQYSKMKYLKGKNCSFYNNV